MDDLKYFYVLKIANEVKWFTKLRAAGMTKNVLPWASSVQIMPEKKIRTLLNESTESIKA